MPLLYFLAEVFINTFGITQPSTPQQRRLVSLVLGGFLLTVIVVVFSITGFLVYELHAGR
jgi:dipeptide/tripeptide permease